MEEHIALLFVKICHQYKALCEDITKVINLAACTLRMIEVPVTTFKNSGKRCLTKVYECQLTDSELVDHLKMRNAVQQPHMK